MAGVFISYRSADSGAYGALLHLALGRHFGPGLVFLDSEPIPAGADLIETLLSRVRSCRVMLAVIGPEWLVTGNGNGRRIDDPEDWVRRELVEAFAAKAVVIPVLVDGAAMPVEGDLPADIAALGRRQCRWLRHRDASADLARLLADVAAADAELAAAARRRSAAQPATQPAAGRDGAQAAVTAARKGVAEALFGGPAAAGEGAAGGSAAGGSAAGGSAAGGSAAGGSAASRGASALAGWLDPAAGVVRARKRPEAAELVRWCRTKGAPVLRLVCGPAGQGKKQLAGQVCRAVTTPPTGWLAGFVRPPAVLSRDGSAAGAVTAPDVGRGKLPGALGQSAAMAAALRALPATDVPGVLLVVDHAEGGPEFVSALLREAVAVDGPRPAGRAVPVRILLLARDEPDWWRNLADLAEPGRVEPRPLALRSLPEALAVGRRGAAEATRTLWTDAVEAFTARAVRDRLLAEMPPPGQLTASPPAGFATTLDLYADALLRVLEHAGHAAAGGTGPAATRLAIEGWLVWSGGDRAGLAAAGGLPRS
jgi:hypothetical protein